jgi:hypothetical protein
MHAIRYCAGIICINIHYLETGMHSVQSRSHADEGEFAADCVRGTTLSIHVEQTHYRILSVVSGVAGARGKS